MKCALAILACAFSVHALAQCDVTITPDGSTSFCEGDSVSLLASAQSDSLQLDQVQDFYNGGTSARNLPGYSYWQSFTAGISGTLVQIDAGFFTLIDGTGYWTVWEGEGTGGLMLDSQELNIYCSGGNCLLAFYENIEVTEGNTYTFQIRGGTGMPDPYGLQIGAGNPYSDGVMGFVDPSGTYLTEFDWVFNTWVSGGVIYLWSNGETDSMIVVDESGTYSVISMGTGGCNDTAEVEVTVWPLPEVSMSVADDTVCTGDATVALYGEPVGGVFSGQGVSYEVFAPSSAGVFTVYYTYTDVNGCTGTDSATIVVEVCAASPVPDELASITCIVAGNQLIIQSDQNLHGASLRIVNSSGGTILRQVLDGSRLVTEMEDFPPGIYFYQLTTESQQTKAGKFILSRQE